MKVELVWIAENAESLIAYMARVSNPDNQNNPSYSKLIKYLIDHQHWSPLETVNACFYIETSRAISAQIMRHRSFSFQELSQRYTEINDVEPAEVRRQCDKNRQSSTEVFNPEFDFGHEQITASDLINRSTYYSTWVYNRLIESGVAREVARMVLPMSSKTRLYMNGTIRSWIHYINLRTQPETQKEHKLIAEEIKSIFINKLPIISEALGWTNDHS